MSMTVSHSLGQPMNLPINWLLILSRPAEVSAIENRREDEMTFGTRMRPRVSS